MQRLALTAILTSICTLTCISACTAAPRSRGELVRHSSHQLQGEVKHVELTRELDTRRDGHFHVDRFVIEIAVTSVQKGKGIAAGDTVRVHCCTRRWVGQGFRADAGHTTVPAQGSTVSMYLQKRENKGKNFDLLAPNGCTIHQGSNLVPF